MILQSLTAYYEALARRGEIARSGWATTKVSFALELGADGSLLRVVRLESVPEDGKKPLLQCKNLPAPVKRTVGIAPNFLWDSSSYLLGLDGKGKPERAKDCFAAAKQLHQQLHHKIFFSIRFQKNIFLNQVSVSLMLVCFLLTVMWSVPLTWLSNHLAYFVVSVVFCHIFFNQKQTKKAR